MTESSSEIMAGVGRRRRGVVEGFLWTLAGFVGATMVVNAIAFPDAGLSARSLAPNGAFLALVGAALWLNRRGRMKAALGLVIAAVIGTVASSLVVNGPVPDTAVALFVLFLPVTLAGLLLDRAGLVITTAASLAAVLVPAWLHAAGVVPWAVRPAVATLSSTFQASLILVIVAFFLERFGSSLERALRAVSAREIVLSREMTEHRRARRALAAETDFTDAVVNSLPGVFYVLDEAGGYVRWNRNFAEMLGYSPEELARLDPAQTIALPERARVLHRLARPDARGTARTKATLVSKDGETHPYLLTIDRITTGERAYTIGVGADTRDLDEAQARIQRLNEELQERLDRMAALHEIDKAITGSLDLDLTLGVILEQVRGRLRVDAASVLLYKARSQRLRFGAAAGFAAGALRTTDLRLGQGQAGRAALARERVTVRGADAVREAFGRSDRITAEGFTTYLAVPLLSKGQLQGVLELFHGSELDTTEDWSTFLTSLATQVAIALDNATLFERMERSNAELRLAYDTTIEGWARALDLRDEETEGHSRRVTGMAVRLAGRLGVDEEKLEHLRRGALLHDIGKMGVPDAILLKPGKLDDEEWAVMARHPTLAFELLAPIEFLRPALDIPYAHHERWDGSGYPRRLAGEKIPLAARIFAVVDVFDALTSDRPYRGAWSERAALTHVEEQAGRQFDPDVVQAFLHMQHVPA